MLDCPSENYKFFRAFFHENSYLTWYGAWINKKKKKKKKTKDERAKKGGKRPLYF
jgi:hypothetical protein